MSMTFSHFLDLLLDIERTAADHTGYLVMRNDLAKGWAEVLNSDIDPMDGHARVVPMHDGYAALLWLFPEADSRGAEFFAREDLAVFIEDTRDAMSHSIEGGAE